MPRAERIAIGEPSGSPMADLQAGLATLGPKLGPEAARRHRARAGARRSGTAVGGGALDRRAGGAGRRPAVPDAEVERGENAAAQFLIRWRGEADPKHVTAVDTYWVSAAEHGMNASTFTARIAASTGADCAAAMSAAVGALSGPLHGGAPTRVLKMLDEVEASGDAEAYVRGILDRGERIMGFGHRVYRAEDPRARVLRRTARELESPRVEVAEALEEAALAALREKSPDRVLETNVEFWAAVVLDIAEHPARHVPGDVRLRARRRLVGAHRRAAPDGPADPPVGARTSGRPHARWPKRDARRGRGGGERARRRGARAGARRAPIAVGRGGRGGGSLAGLPRARRRLPRDRAVPLPAEDRAPAARPRGREPGLPRLGAALARAALARPSERRQRRAAAAARARRERRQRRGAAAGDRRAAERLAAAGHDRDPRPRSASDDEQSRELREAAAKIAQLLRRKAGPAR